MDEPPERRDDARYFDEERPSRADTVRYEAQLARFRKRKTLAQAVGIACNVLAFLMIALGAALTLGSLNTVSGEYLADRYVPGADTSITLPESGTYAITADGDLPECTVVDLDGNQLPVTRTTTPGAEARPIGTFEADKGGYRVTCEGGNEGVVVFATNQLDIVTHGWLGLMLTALPFIAVGVALYVVGRIAPGRIAPETLRPVVPS